MKTHARVLVASLLIFPGSAGAFQGESKLADHALAIVLAEMGAHIDSTGVWIPGSPYRFPEELRPGLSFGGVSASLNRNDLDPSRFHEPGETTWQELRALDRERVEARWRDAAGAAARTEVLSGRSLLLEQGEGNVVASYLVLHLIALRFAAERGSDPRLALLYEAGAESYLRAAFFSAHMLVPFGSPLWPLHAENTRRMHHHFRDTGLYVQNGLGDTWQTFGDEILESHHPTYRFLLEASAVSLREVFWVVALRSGNKAWASQLMKSATTDTELVVAAERWTPRYRDLILGHHDLLPGSKIVNRFSMNASLAGLEARTKRWLDVNTAPETYLHSPDASLPALRLVPVPVTATLVGPEDGAFSDDESPQLKDAGYHDPGLTPDELRRLPLRSQFPETADLRAWNPEYVSVLYPAPAPFPPSFLGWRTDLGFAQLAGESGSTIGFSGGLGYAWPAGLYDLFGRLGYISGLNDGFLTATFGPRIENPFPAAGLRWIDAFLLEVGYVHDLEGSWSESGGVLGLSAMTRAWAGLTPAVNMGPALQLGGRLYVRKLPLVGVFAAVGFQ
jgi:hypothetical protein